MSLSIALSQQRQCAYHAFYGAAKRLSTFGRPGGRNRGKRNSSALKWRSFCDTVPKPSTHSTCLSPRARTRATRFFDKKS